jgi:hypothetical protein
MFGDKLRQVAVLVGEHGLGRNRGSDMAERRKVYWVFVDERQLAIRGVANPFDPFLSRRTFRATSRSCGSAANSGSGGEAVLAIFAAIRHVDVVDRYDTADRHIFLPRAANAGKNLKFWLEFDMRVGDGVLRWMRSGTGLSHNDGQSWPAS